VGHQCVHCGEIYPDAAPELLKGCKCGSKFFYYVKNEKIEQLRNDIQDTLFDISKAEKDKIEKDIREITGMTEDPDRPVILDIESIRVIEPGKYEIDIINLFSKSRPLIYKLGEGKYIIDLKETVKASREDINKKIINPKTFSDESEEDNNDSKEESD